MAGGKLTDKAIKNAKRGEQLVILSGGGGLQLWLTPTGGKLWNYAYRFGGKRKRLAEVAAVGRTHEALLTYSSESALVQRLIA